MSRRPAMAHLFGFAAIVGGLLLLAYTQVGAVLPDQQRTELESLRQGGLLSETTGVVLSALLITLGAIVILARASPAPRVPRSIALAVFALALPVFLIVQTLLVINGGRVDYEESSAVYFSASYFFHGGDDWSFATVYILFVFTLVLTFILLGCVGYLLAPHRFGRAVFDRFSWPKNEAVHVAATLFLLLSVGVLFYYLIRLASDVDRTALRGHGLLADNLVPLYYLLGLLLLAFGLTVAAHAFLLNWGNHAPVEFHRLVENIRTIARVERVLLAAAALLNLVILMAPTLPSNVILSHSNVFGVSPHGFAYAFYLLLVPYIPYVVTQRRLDFLLRAGRGPATNAPFAERSLRLVLFHVLGLIVLLALGAGSGWEPLSLMLAFGAWTAGVLLAYAVRLETSHGLPRFVFSGDAGPSLYFVFLGLAVTTGLMLWGSGNTYEVAYLPQAESLDFINESGYGADIFARLGAAVLIAGSLIFTLDLWLQSYQVRRRFLVHYVSMFVLSTIAVLLVFTVGVWTEGSAGIDDAYAGFAFRQYYAFEEIGAGVLLVATAAYLFYALGRILRPVLDVGRENRAAPSVVVRWK